MPHGDFSDVAALFCACTGLASIFAPNLWFSSFGPLKPMFDGRATVETLAAARFAGGLLFVLFPTLYVVRWNTLNGKAAALGFTGAAINTAHMALSKDNFTFVPSGWWVFVAAFVVSALHLAFNANPMLTSAMLREKEAARAAKAK